MPLHRIEINVITGQSRTVALSAQEEAEAWARTSAEASKGQPKSNAILIAEQIAADTQALSIVKAALEK